MQKSKGFTIIELLVVVAIIAVLTGIVLVNVTSYINKGKDASIKGNLSTMLTNGAGFYDDNGNYTNFTTYYGATVPAAAIVAAYGTGGAVSYGVPTATAWCACSALKQGAPDTFCVDSTGQKKQTATACATECAAAVCI